MDATRHKETVLKVCLQPWIDEAYVITAFIEEKLAQMQGLYVLRQTTEPHKEATEEPMQQVQQTAERCIADLLAVREQLEGFSAKIATPAE